MHNFREKTRAMASALRSASGRRGADVEANPGVKAQARSTAAPAATAVAARLPSRMAGCARFAPALLAHVNLLLALFAGAGLATAARLKWDPSTYIALRRVLPTEYRAAAVMLTAASFALLLLGHLATVALATRRTSTRRVFFIMYAVLMTALMLVEVAWCVWTALRLYEWLHSPPARHMLDALDLRDHLRPILQFFGRFHPLPQRIKELMEEAEADVPRNFYVGGATAVLLALLQPLAASLALVLAAYARHAPRASLSWATSTTSAPAEGNEKAPLRTAYKNGRIVIL